MPAETALIIGLGNPGPRYAETRHNLGAMALEELLSRSPGARLSSHRRTNTDIAQFRLSPGGPAVVAARLRCPMNLSGGPTKALCSFFHVEPTRLFVIHDELEAPFGSVALRPGGGDHGHNGLKSISSSLKTRAYVRVSLGIGRPPGRMDPARFVLQAFSRSERADLPIICADAADAIEAAL